MNEFWLFQRGCGREKEGQRSVSVRCVWREKCVLPCIFSSAESVPLILQHSYEKGSGSCFAFYLTMTSSKKQQSLSSLICFISLMRPLFSLTATGRRCLGLFTRAGWSKRLCLGFFGGARSRWVGSGGPCQAAGSLSSSSPRPKGVAPRAGLRRKN